MELKVEVSIISEALEVGTRVHWDGKNGSLYFVDVPTSLLYKYQPSSGITTKVLVGNEPLGFAFPVNDDDTKFVAALGRKFVLITWDGTSNSTVTKTELIGEVEPELLKNRLNGGKVDPCGRLWAGTMGPTNSDGETEPHKGSLYSVTKGVIKKHDSNIGISNGIAWDLQLAKMYYIDTLFKGVYQYDYNSTTGEIANRTVIFKFEDYSITDSPDGMTIDTRGNLWVCVIYGSLILQIDPRSGKLLKKLEIPTPQVTAATFGDGDLSTLYVTSARMKRNGNIPAYPGGCTFSIKNVGAKGLPGDRYKHK